MSKQPVNENITTMCASCDIDLATCDTIWAAKGILYCSRDCGIQDYKNTELSFDELAEELNPRDIGLEPEICNWCGKCSEDLSSTDLGWLCNACIQAICKYCEKIKEVK